MSRLRSIFGSPVLLHAAPVAPAPHPQGKQAPARAAPAALVRPNCLRSRRSPPTPSGRRRHRAPPPEMLVAVRKIVEPPPPFMPPLPKDKPLVAAMRQVLEKHPEEAARELEKHGPSATACLPAQVTANVSEDDIDRLPPVEAAALLDHLRDMSRAVSKRAPLELRRLAYCRSIAATVRRGGGLAARRRGAEAQPGEAVQVYARWRPSAARRRRRATNAADGPRWRCGARTGGGSGWRRCWGVPWTGAVAAAGLLLNCRFHVPAGAWCGRVRAVGDGEGRDGRQAARGEGVAAVQGGGTDARDQVPAATGASLASLLRH